MLWIYKFLRRDTTYVYITYTIICVTLFLKNWIYNKTRESLSNIVFLLWVLRNNKARMIKFIHLNPADEEDHCCFFKKSTHHIHPLSLSHESPPTGMIVDSSFKDAPQEDWQLSHKQSQKGLTCDCEKRKRVESTWEPSQAGRSSVILYHSHAELVSIRDSPLISLIHKEKQNEIREVIHHSLRVMDTSFFPTYLLQERNHKHTQCGVSLTYLE